jgi:hypothetical protein
MRPQKRGLRERKLQKRRLLRSIGKVAEKKIAAEMGDMEAKKKLSK